MLTETQGLASKKCQTCFFCIFNAVALSSFSLKKCESYNKEEDLIIIILYSFLWFTEII